MNKQINTEQEFDKCVEKIGGIIKRWRFFKQPANFCAAYLVEKYNVVAELKCLTDDKSIDKSPKQKVK
ncbi:hypothetical protein [uncultured Amphritea sp.]|uniref:hypothetical protein n=1 Tax=uncultured Amphritea sp. TaxID=981605 RepID=UPI0026253DF4|nr:hypothetical protein [uncultured Amphritea sp.]